MSESDEPVLKKIVPRRRALVRLVEPFQAFFRLEASSGILLILCAVAALLWANSPWWHSYHALWEIKLEVGLGDWVLSKSLHHWINDGLMAIFFFVVGLEIKREILAGELSSMRKAALPVAAAAGGMIVPAAVYLVFNWGQAGVTGWGIPMATDIAFALGVLYMLGDKVSLPLRVFLAALAIVDDIGAVLVIALFYTDDLSTLALVVAGGFFLAMVVANRLRLRHPYLYFFLGCGLWLGMLYSGVHATLAGVVAALSIPVRTRIASDEFLERARSYLDEFKEGRREDYSLFSTEKQRAALENLEDATEKIQSPLQRLESGLHGWVVYGVMPVFALANAGIHLGEGLAGAWSHPVTIGTFLGLLVGKQVGVTGASWLAVRLGFADLPAGVRWRQIYGVSWLAAIGFTMALFITNLAFDDSMLIDMAKVGILAASVVAGLVGWAILFTAPPTPLSALGEDEEERTGEDDDVERSTGDAT